VEFRAQALGLGLDRGDDAVQTAYYHSGFTPKGAP
jgi:hypothetical protein